MSSLAQKRALTNYRQRLKTRGVTRFEVLGLETDRNLIRTLAGMLAQGNSESKRIRLEIDRTVTSPAKKGNILASLRRSPLVGADLKIERPFDKGRKTVL
ncbi:MAG: hypothetical protein FWD64_02330 [Acidobacteriaceae bacterium]|nr:hypothetical protein [Acidobacteriaceae bacterium]